MKITVLIPIHNDWDALFLLLEKIENLPVETLPEPISIYVVDDGSTQPLPIARFQSIEFQRIQSLGIIEMVCNYGHQHALAVGLAHITSQEELGIDGIVVMDGDGEDFPGDIPALCNAFRQNPEKIILAARLSRSEGTIFTVFYRFYKLMYKLLTSHHLSFGNFCLLPMVHAKRLVYMHSLWSSLPGAVLRSKIPNMLVGTHRGTRLSGSSHMNFVALVLHGLHAIMVFADVVLVRLTVMVNIFSFFAIILVTLIRVFTTWVPLGWASNMVGFLFLFILLSLLILVSTSLVMLQNQSRIAMLPAIHGSMFIRRIYKIFG